MFPSPTNLATPLTRVRLMVLVVLLATFTDAVLAQGDAPALERLRVLDGDSGAELAVVADGDTLDLTATDVRAVVLEPLEVSGTTRSVTYALGEAAPTVVNLAPFVLGSGPTEVATIALEVPVRTSEDDAEEFTDASRQDPGQFPAGFTFHSSSDLDLRTDPEHSEQVIGIRFADVDIPSDATIEEASVVFTADGSSSGALTVRLTGERSADSQPFPQDPFANGSYAISSRERTDSSVSWIVDEPWQSQTEYATPDLARIVRELVGLPAWQPGGALTFIIEPEEGQDDAFRRAFSYDGRGDVDNRAPRLQLTLVVPPSRAAAAPLALPDGASTLTVTPHGRFDADGAAGSPLRVHVERPSTVEGTPSRPTSTPEPEPEPERDPEPEPDVVTDADVATDATDEAPVEAPVEPPVEAAPVEVSELDEPPAVDARIPDASSAGASLMPLGDSNVRGTLYLERNDDGSGTTVTIALDEPLPSALSISLRSGTCAAPGDVLTGLEPVAAGARSSSTDVAVSPTALRLGGFVALASSDSPVACGALTPDAAAAAIGARLSPLGDSGVRGTLYLERDDARGGSIVSIILAEPVVSTLRVSLRSGTCAAPGDVLTTLEPVVAGALSSRTAVAVSPTALRLGGFVAYASNGTPLACGALTPNER